MINILLGAEGSGIEHRTEKQTAVTSITDSDIQDNAVSNLATQYNGGRALFYVNSLIGLRRAEIDLFFAIKDNFNEICAIIDRAESIAAEDRKTIQDDIILKLGLREENIYFIKKNDAVSDLVKIGLKFIKSEEIIPDKSLIAAKKRNAMIKNKKNISNADGNFNECGNDKNNLYNDSNNGNDNDIDESVEEVFLPAIAAMSIFIAILTTLYYIAESFSHNSIINGRSKKSMFSFIYAIIKYLIIFSGTLTLIFTAKKYTGGLNNEK